MLQVTAHQCWQGTAAGPLAIWAHYAHNETAKKEINECILELSSASPVLQSKMPCPGNGALLSGHSPLQIKTIPYRFALGQLYLDSPSLRLPSPVIPGWVKLTNPAFSPTIFPLYPGYQEARNEFGTNLKIPCARYWTFVCTPFSPAPYIPVLKSWLVHYMLMH